MTWMDLVNAVGSGVMWGLAGAVVTAVVAALVRPWLAASLILAGAALAATISGLIAYAACASLSC